MTPLPTHVDLAVLTAHNAAFSHSGWIVELKLDGYRALALRDGESPTLLSRNGNSLATSFPEVQAGLDSLPPGTALDGELVIPRRDAGQDFEALQQRARLKLKQRVATAAAAAPAQLHVFDVLMVDGQDVQRKDLLARKALVEQILSSVGGNVLRRVEWFDGCEGSALFEATRQMGLEGVVMKRKDSQYLRGTGSGWLKVKHREHARPARSWRA